MSYCDDQGIKLYTYKHTNLDFAANPYVPGDRIVKSGHDPDVAVVVECGANGDDAFDGVFSGQLENGEVPPGKLTSYCEEQELKRYSYDCSEIDYVESA